jgi:hypothetical protein
MEIANISGKQLKLKTEQELRNRAPETETKNRATSDEHQTK